MTCIGLLRGINVSGHHKIPMTELRSMCAAIGFSHVQTYIQSGNLVFSTSGNPATIESELEHAIARHFHFQIPVIVRKAADWSACITGNPFPKASREEPNRVMLALAKASPKPEAASELRDRAVNGERVAQVGEALWIHFAEGVAGSKLSPSLLDRLVGSSVTMRNWRTVLKLGELAGLPIQNSVNV